MQPLKKGDRFTLEFEVVTHTNGLTVSTVVGLINEPYNMNQFNANKMRLATNIIPAPVELAVGQMWRGHGRCPIRRKIIAVTTEGVLFIVYYDLGPAVTGCDHELFNRYYKGELVTDA